MRPQRPRARWPWWALGPSEDPPEEEIHVVVEETEMCICEFGSSCHGQGVLYCAGCGGDLCVCTCGGETECDGCSECPRDDEADDERQEDVVKKKTPLEQAREVTGDAVTWTQERDEGPNVTLRSRIGSHVLDVQAWPASVDGPAGARVVLDPEWTDEEGEEGCSVGDALRKRLKQVENEWGPLVNLARRVP